MPINTSPKVIRKSIAQPRQTKQSDIRRPTRKYVYDPHKNVGKKGK